VKEDLLEGKGGGTSILLQFSREMQGRRRGPSSLKFGRVGIRNEKGGWSKGAGGEPDQERRGNDLSNILHPYREKGDSGETLEGVKEWRKGGSMDGESELMREGEDKNRID